MLTAKSVFRRWIEEARIFTDVLERTVLLLCPCWSLWGLSKSVDLLYFPFVIFFLTLSICFPVLFCVFVHLRSVTFCVSVSVPLAKRVEPTAPGGALVCQQPNDCG